MSKFIYKPVEIKAIQFNGTVESCEKIVEMGAPVVYVPREYDRALRRDSEHDGSNGNILKVAEAFLILYMGKSKMRADINWWIVLSSSSSFTAWAPKAFEETFIPMNDAIKNNLM